MRSNKNELKIPRDKKYRAQSAVPYKCNPTTRQWDRTRITTFRHVRSHLSSSQPSSPPHPGLDPSPSHRPHPRYRVSWPCLLRVGYPNPTRQCCHGYPHGSQYRGSYKPQSVTCGNKESGSGGETYRNASKNSLSLSLSLSSSKYRSCPVAAHLPFPCSPFLTVGVSSPPNSSSSTRT